MATVSATESLRKVARTTESPAQCSIDELMAYQLGRVYLESSSTSSITTKILRGIIGGATTGGLIALSRFFYRRRTEIKSLQEESSVIAFDL